MGYNWIKTWSVSCMCDVFTSAEGALKVKDQVICEGWDATNVAVMMYVLYHFINLRTGGKAKTVLVFGFNIFLGEWCVSWAVYDGHPHMLGCTKEHPLSLTSINSQVSNSWVVLGVSMLILKQLLFYPSPCVLGSFKHLFYKLQWIDPWNFIMVIT